MYLYKPVNLTYVYQTDLSLILNCSLLTALNKIYKHCFLSTVTLRYSTYCTIHSYAIALFTILLSVYSTSYVYLVVYLDVSSH